MTPKERRKRKIAAGRCPLTTCGGNLDAEYRCDRCEQVYPPKQAAA